MDINYHYYVTHTAAMAAGFSANDALLIARAAQYVDDCKNETTQTPGQTILNNFSDSCCAHQRELQKIANIWPIFHFLPGDKPQIEPLLDNDLKNTSTHSQKRLYASLICGTESSLVNDIVNDARSVVQQSRAAQTPGAPIFTDSVLLYIGITMHVLADTYAHQGFAGVPMGSINDAYDVMKLESGVYKTMPYIYGPAPSEESFGNLGHSRMGHLPDCPGLILSYQPAWTPSGSRLRITRDNPMEFCRAFLEMLTALLYISAPQQANAFQLHISPADVINPDRPIGNLSLTQRLNVKNAFSNSPEDSNLPLQWFPNGAQNTDILNYPMPVPYVVLEPPEATALLHTDFLTQANQFRTNVIGHSTALQNLNAYIATL